MYVAVTVSPSDAIPRSATPPSKTPVEAAVSVTVTSTSDPPAETATAKLSAAPRSRSMSGSVTRTVPLSPSAYGAPTHSTWPKFHRM